MSDWLEGFCRLSLWGSPMRGWKLALAIFSHSVESFVFIKFWKARSIYSMPPNSALNQRLVNKGPAANLKGYHTIYLPCRHSTSGEV